MLRGALEARWLGTFYARRALTYSEGSVRKLALGTGLAAIHRRRSFPHRVEVTSGGEANAKDAQDFDKTDNARQHVRPHFCSPTAWALRYAAERQAFQ